MSIARIFNKAMDPIYWIGNLVPSLRGGVLVAIDPKLVEECPRSPGVYLMKDGSGRVIYVGKAKDLKARLSSYLRPGADSRYLVSYLLREVEDVEVVVTGTEKEALILENNLIKRHRPRYNVRFRDDKDYVHIRIEVQHPFPRITIARRPKEDGALYFGPYSSAHAARGTLRFIQRHIGLRTCKDVEMKLARRTCINEQMGRCSGVCRGRVTQEEYALRVQEAIMFLEGRSKELLGQLKKRMKEASELLKFEEAARLRDQIREIERTIEEQRVDTPLGKDRDVVALHRVGMGGTIAVLRVSRGKVVEKLTFPVPPTPQEDGEILASFLKQFYQDRRNPAPEILVSHSLEEETHALQQWLGERRGARVRIRRPIKGEAKGLVDMAEENARLTSRQPEGWEETARGLMSALGLGAPPRVIDAFDISNLGGHEAVGSAVRFVDGVPEKNMYRSYRVRTTTGPDDYAMLYEVLRRHLLRKKQEGSLPDLIMVDGGKGQLGVALAVLQDLDLKGIQAIALAKDRGGTEESAGDRIFLPGKKDPLPVQRAGGITRVLVQLRDEAHRFALSLHRRRRGKSRMSSPLDDIPGIGPKRKKALLKHLGSLREIENSTVEELCKVPGISKSLAQRIHDVLRSKAVGGA